MPPKATAAGPALLSALESFICRIGKDQFEFQTGDLIDADHPVARKYPDMFGPPRVRYPHPRRVEQATAGPGEQRGDA